MENQFESDSNDFVPLRCYRCGVDYSFKYRMIFLTMSLSLSFLVWTDFNSRSCGRISVAFIYLLFNDYITTTKRQLRTKQL